MLKCFIVSIIALFWAIAPLKAADADQSLDTLTARQIMDKVDQRDDGDNKISTIRMILFDRKNQKTIRELKGHYKDFGEDTYKLLFFLKPADVEDTGFLTYDYDGDKSDDQWLYLPALRKTKRIASDDKTGSFMGSDFTYGDLTKKEPDDFKYKIIKDDIEVGGESCWLIESLPKTEKVLKRYGYKRSLLFVRKDNFFTIRAVKWEEHGGKIKYMDVKKLKKIDGIWTSLEIHMTTKVGKITQHKTIWICDSVKYKQSIDNSVFTVQRMERGL